MGLTSIDLGLDTGILLESMVKEARMVVFNAVAKATSATKSLSIDSNLLKKEGMKGNAPSPLSSGFNSALKLSPSQARIASGRKLPGVREGQQEMKGNAPSPLSSGFNSALKLSPSQARIASSRKLPGVREGQHRPSHRSMKAHNSSLKLNKVLSYATIQKTRSVQFGTLDLKVKGANTVPKGQKLQTTAKLASFKSFGRPHAGDFGSDGGPKNATFANFGGSKKYWGRDGKLASKPRPMLPTETTDMMTSQTRRNMNATFDTAKPPIHLSRSTGLSLPKKKTSEGASSFPRTATAAEGWLLESMKNL